MRRMGNRSIILVWSPGLLDPDRVKKNLREDFFPEKIRFIIAGNVGPGIRAKSSGFVRTKDFFQGIPGIQCQKIPKH